MSTSNQLQNSRSQRIANRLNEVLLDGRWIANTQWSEQINLCSFERAVMRPQGMNSVAMLTFHVGYYLRGILDVLEGAPLSISDSHSFNMTPIDSESDWDTLRADFLQNSKALIAAVRSMNEERLDQTFVRPEYGTWERNLEALTEHAYYHLGQVVLLGKMTQREV